MRDAESAVGLSFQADLNAFAALLHSATAHLSAGQLVGPIRLPASTLLPNGMPIFIGTVVTVLGSGAR